MKPTKVSGIVAYVKNTALTAEFYDALGFTFSKREPNHLSLDIAGFWIDFHPQDQEDKPDFQREATLSPKGAGQFLYVKVDDVDAYYALLLGHGLKPSSSPRDWPWGNREFVIRDPDGYKLVFFNTIR